MTECTVVSTRRINFFKAKDLFSIVFPHIGDTNISRNMDYVDDDDKLLYKIPGTMGRPSLYCSLKGIIQTLLRLDQDKSREFKEYVIEASEKLINDKYFIDPGIKMVELQKLKDEVNELIEKHKS